MAALALLEDIANRAIRRERVFRDRADFFAHDDEWLISSVLFRDDLIKVLPEQWDALDQPGAGIPCHDGQLDTSIG
ncbi:hypothetical protein SKAU_G00102010 [Synaphobranchus kaupii]|uniref:Uncharacterized protein n=1 Tax=Synaphobranchus kaupii TaxID=118154 RepID=A0A9Q1J7J6_SYNKA|nr:hypothetical protein SKAU_G00102010 [Synaphobranchus kaupii]